MATIRDCKRIQPLLSEYVDGTLTEEQAWTVQMHVSTCAVCSQIAEDFTATTRLLAALPEPKLSENFEAMLAKRLADESLQPQPLTLWTRCKSVIVEAWHRPSVRMGMATGTVLAMIVPMAFFATSKGIVPGKAPVATATPEVIMGSTNSLEQLLTEHVTYASSEPFSEHSGLLPSGDL
jgi:anti-sigma factor RsiW